MPVYSSTIKGQRTIYYRFTCGKCGITTSWMPKIIEAECCIATRIFSERKVEKELQLALQKKLGEYVVTIMKGTERGYYFRCPPRTKDEYRYDFDSACPYCKQKDRREFIYSTPVRGIILFGLIGMFVGLIVFIIAIMSSKIYTLNDILIPTILFFVPILIGCVLGFCIGKKSTREGIEHTNIEYRW